jgi:hypothetical protein
VYSDDHPAIASTRERIISLQAFKAAFHKAEAQLSEVLTRALTQGTRTNAHSSTQSSTHSKPLGNVLTVQVTRPDVIPTIVRTYIQLGRLCMRAVGKSLEAVTMFRCACYYLCVAVGPVSGQLADVMYLLATALINHCGMGLQCRGALSVWGTASVYTHRGAAGASQRDGGMSARSQASVDDGANTPRSRSMSIHSITPPRGSIGGNGGQTHTPRSGGMMLAPLNSSRSNSGKQPQQQQPYSSRSDSGKHSSRASERSTNSSSNDLFLFDRPLGDAGFTLFDMVDNSLSVQNMGTQSQLSMIGDSEMRYLRGLSPTKSSYPGSNYGQQQQRGANSVSFYDPSTQAAHAHAHSQSQSPQNFFGLQQQPSSGKASDQVGLSASSQPDADTLTQLMSLPYMKYRSPLTESQLSTLTHAETVLAKCVDMYTLCYNNTNTHNANNNVIVNDERLAIKQLRTIAGVTIQQANVRFLLGKYDGCAQLLLKLIDAHSKHKTTYALRAANHSVKELAQANCMLGKVYYAKQGMYL